MQGLEKHFEEWKMLLKFVYDEEPKSWITKDNFHNQFTDEFDELMGILWLISKRPAISETHREFHWSMSNKLVTIGSRGRSAFPEQIVLVEYQDGNLKQALYRAIIRFIAWYNKELI